MREYSSEFLWSQGPAGLCCVGGKLKLALLLREIIHCFHGISTHALGGLSRCCKDLGASECARIKSSGVLQPQCGPESIQKELLLTKHHRVPNLKIEEQRCDVPTCSALLDAKKFNK